MRIYLSLILIILLTGCVTAQPTIQPDRLQPQEIAVILRAAVKDIQAQGYEPMFLSETGGSIWARDKDGNMLIYPLQPLIDKMRENKLEQGK